jgi:hypothetical protein
VLRHANHLLKPVHKYCACHRDRPSTHYENCCDVTKCHACHTKRGCAMFETFKSDHFCSTPHRHGRSDLMRTLANGCKRLRTVASSGERLRTQTQRVANTPSIPQTETGTPAAHSGIMFTYRSVIVVAHLKSR